MASLLKGTDQVSGPVLTRPAVVVGRAGTVRPLQPDRGASGIMFRLADGSGAIDVFHEGTLDVREGQLVKVQGRLEELPDEPPRLLADQVWILPARAP